MIAETAATRTHLCLECRTALMQGEACDGGRNHRVVSLHSAEGREGALREVWGSPTARRRARELAKAGGVGAASGGALDLCSGLDGCDCLVGGGEGFGVVLAILAIAGAVLLIYFIVVKTIEWRRRKKNRLKPHGALLKPRARGVLLRGSIAALPGQPAALGFALTLHHRGGLREGVTMGPSVDESQMETVLQGIATAKKEGAKVLLGGERLQGEEHRRGFFIAPTILGGITPTMTVAQEELFGPVLAILAVKDAEQALEVANGVRYGLSSSIFTRDVNRVFAFLDRIETGITHVNSPTVGGEAHLPFGGVKATGIGAREQGSTAIEFYSELKTVYIDFTGRARQTKIY